MAHTVAEATRHKQDRRTSGERHNTGVSGPGSSSTVRGASLGHAGNGQLRGPLRLPRSASSPTSRFPIPAPFPIPCTLQLLPYPTLAMPRPPRPLTRVGPSQSLQQGPGARPLTHGMVTPFNPAPAHTTYEASPSTSTKVATKP